MIQNKLKGKAGDVRTKTARSEYDIVNVSSSLEYLKGNRIIKIRTRPDKRILDIQTLIKRHKKC
jgi:hypothetical protein